MVIGRGDIATAIKDKDGYIYYVNGVSNRIPITENTACREVTEVNNISSTIRSEMFVYVSTLSVYYSSTDYTKHKTRMESLIKKNFENYAILRIGNITWGDNPNTIINNLGFKIANKQHYEVRDEYRYILKRDEFRHWVGLIPRYGKHEMNITSTRHKVKDIVKMIKDGKL